MRYKVGVVKKITFLFMTIGLAVALVACQGAVGKTGEPGPSGPPGPSGEPPDPVNLAPIARAATFDAVMLREGGDSAAPINVAANFVDPEGQPLTLTYSVDVEGVVAVDLTDGVLTVAPVATGTAVITVMASDGDKSASATLNVTVADAGAPIYVGMLTGTALTYGSQHVIPGTDIESAFEGEGLSFGAERSGGDDVVVVSPIADDNTVTITARNTDGRAEVTITATDEDGETVSRMIEILVREKIVPEASGTPATVTLAVGGEADTVDVSGYFSDPMVGDLTYAALSDDESVAIAGTDGSSMVEIEPVGNGSTMVTVTATNAYGSADQMISVTVAETPPTAVAGGIPAQTLSIGDQRNVGLGPYFTPGEHGSSDLTYTSSVDSTPTGAVTARVSGSDLIIDAHMAGSATITVTATDGEGETAMQAVMVTVEEDEIVEPPAENMAPRMKAGMMLDDLRIQLVADSGENGQADDTADGTVDNKTIDLSKYFEDPDGPLLFYKVEKTETPDDSDNTPVIDLHSTPAVTTSGSEAAATGDAPDGTDVSESMVVIEPRNVGSATVTVTVTDVDGDAITDEFEVTVVASGTNEPPAIGSESTSDTAIPDLVGVADTDPANDNVQRLKIGETRKAFDGNISVLFNDPDFAKPDRPNEMLTLSVKYFPVEDADGTAISDTVAAMSDTEELAADKVGVSHTLSTTTWNGSSSAKLTLSLTGTRGTPIGEDADEADDGQLVALIATDEYGVSFAHVLRVIVNHAPKAEGAQAEDPKTLGSEMGHMDLGFNSVTATENYTRVVLVEDDGGYFHDPDGATASMTCRIKSSTGTSGDNPAFKFTLQAETGDAADPRGLRIETLKAQGTGSVTIACLDAYGESSPDATLRVRATHQSVSRH